MNLNLTNTPKYQINLSKICLLLSFFMFDLFFSGKGGFH